jgi:hypothetical protein
MTEQLDVYEQLGIPGVDASMKNCRKEKKGIT